MCALIHIVFHTICSKDELDYLLNKSQFLISHYGAAVIVKHKH